MKFLNIKNFIFRQNCLDKSLQMHYNKYTMLMMVGRGALLPMLWRRGAYDGAFLRTFAFINYEEES